MNELSNAASALDVLRRAVESIGDDQLGYQTPCRDYDVAALAGHLVDSVTRISAAAGVVVPAPIGSTITQRGRRRPRRAGGLATPRGRR